MGTDVPKNGTDKTAIRSQTGTDGVSDVSTERIIRSNGKTPPEAHFTEPGTDGTDVGTKLTPDDFYRHNRNNRPSGMVGCGWRAIPYRANIAGAVECFLY